MLWYRVLVISVISVSRVWSSVRPNNVCPTIRDYKTISHNKHCSYNPDVGSRPSLIAKRYGYPFESHQVITEDGYILNLHRIPGSRNSAGSSDAAGRQPIVIFHGLGGSSAFWMLQGKRSLAFFLADNGYDVWLGNWRGNYYSNKHVNSAIKDRDYWNFGFHEMAIHDLPACIDFIANRTGKKGNLIYVGHSMGTTISYIYSTLKREHAEDNLKAIISLAPVAYMKHVMGLFRILAPSTPFFSSILKSKGIYAFGQYHELQRALLGITCGTYPIIIPCNLILIMASGLAMEEFQPALLPLFLSYYPSAISLTTLEHFAQLIVSGRFQMYDYGPTKNMKIYNDTIPPEYDTSQISVPVHLFVGSEDFLGHMKDAGILETRLYSRKGRKGRTESSTHTFPYAHNDFFLGKDLDPFYKALVQDAEILEEHLFKGKPSSGMRTKIFHYAHHDFIMAKHPEYLNEALLQVI